MDSKSLNIAIKHMLHQANWRIHDDYEYVIVGDGITIYEDRLTALISSTIKTDELFYSSDRHSGESY